MWTSKVKEGDAKLKGVDRLAGLDDEVNGVELRLKRLKRPLKRGEQASRRS
jgi:hypothetical protein